MHDFGKLVYLDLQKTGSSYVSNFLNATCRLTEVKAIKHGRIREDFNPSAFHFITVRNPIALYGSLYRYGLDGNGTIFDKLERAGKGQLYNLSNGGFEEWLLFMLDWKNSHLLGEDYAKTPEHYELGFFSFRYFMLSLAYPLITLLLYKDTVDPVGAAQKLSIADFVIRNENLEEGLVELAKIKLPEYFDQEKVDSFLSNAAKRNESSLKSQDLPVVSKSTIELLRHKERALESFYTDT